MYQKYFGFNTKPFDVTPDPRFLYLSEHHQEALASIIYGIRERRGFITLVGEVGTGKTTLLNATLESLDKSTQTAFIFNTDTSFEELLQMVLIEFDLATPEEMVQKYVALDRLNRFATDQFAKGGNVALLIDEAQNLDTRTMENLRLLSNLETRRHKLIQIVLSGQPELDDKLRQNELRQLAQRINMRRYILPLNESDTYQYILQHLSKAGYKGKPLFDRAALEKIWDFSQGVPRKINLLCDNALLIAYGLGKKKITRTIVEEAIRDLNWSPYEKRAGEQFQQPVQAPVLTNLRLPQQRHFAIAAILLLSLVLGVGSFGLLHMGQGGIKAAKQFISGISGYDSAEAPSSVLEQPQAQAMSEEPDDSEPTALTETAIEPEKLPELPDPPEVVIEDVRMPKPESEKQEAPEEPRPAETAEKTMKAEPDVKKPLPAALSAPKGKIIEENLILPPSIRSSADRPGKNSAVYHSRTPARAESGGGRTVTVRKHDYLARIIQANYGTMSESILQRVLDANPKIRNPDVILPGQVIKLPDLETEELRIEGEKLSDSSPESGKKKTPIPLSS